MSNDKTGEKPVRRKTKGSSIYVNQIRVSRVLRCSRKAKLMGSWLIFQHHSCGVERGRRRISKPVIGFWFKPVGVLRRIKRAAKPNGDVEGPRTEVVDSMLPRKAAGYVEAT